MSLNPWAGKTITHSVSYLGEQRTQSYTVSDDGNQRIALWNSYEALKSRSWEQVLQIPDVSLESLDGLYDLMKVDVPVGPYPDKIDLLSKRISARPLMLMEFGFGYTTFELLKWCLKNDAYLVTVELPICPQSLLEGDRYQELYFHGVDRYSMKYKHCVNLSLHPIAQKRWLWINDDIRNFLARITSDSDLRKKIWHEEKLHFMYEDAIHDDQFHIELLSLLRPYMPPGSIFTGHDNCPTVYL